MRASERWYAISDARFYSAWDVSPAAGWSQPNASTMRRKDLRFLLRAMASLMASATWRPRFVRALEDYRKIPTYFTRLSQRAWGEMRYRASWCTPGHQDMCTENVPLYDVLVPLSQQRRGREWL